MSSPAPCAAPAPPSHQRPARRYAYRFPALVGAFRSRDEGRFEVQDEMAARSPSPARHAVPGGTRGLGRQAHGKLQATTLSARQALRSAPDPPGPRVRLQMFENAVAIDPASPLPTPPAPTPAMFYCNTAAISVGGTRAGGLRQGRSSALDLPDVQVSQAWVSTQPIARRSVRMVKKASNASATARAPITYSAAPCLPRDLQKF